MPEERSAQIIIQHVNDGLELAEKYGLPRTIKEFIMTHHGLSKTTYFYIKYRNQHPDEEIDEAMFCYPGPNPFTKEQAILMIADSVEAASKSLKVIDDASIKTLVDNIVDAKMTEGYFKECPITFRDIQQVKEVLVSSLKTIYHTRISYPTLQTKEEKAARLGYLLITNHALVDGNKRIGMHVMLSFLELNGVSIDCTNEDIVEAGMSIAKGEMSYEDVLLWVQSHTSE